MTTSTSPSFDMEVGSPARMPGGSCARLIVSLLLPVALLGLVEPAGGRADEVLSDRVVDYYIAVQLDGATGQLDGIEKIIWRNKTAFPTSQLWFHLYHNAYLNDRTIYIRESEGELKDKFTRESDWGWTRVVTVGPADNPDSAFTWRYGGPDDESGDRTVMVVDLWEAVAPGDSVEIQVEFITKLPYAAVRSGQKGKFFLAAQWFPKLGVFQEGAWHCYPFHWASEFYADFGTYRVDITAPFGYLVGATGVKVREQGLIPGTSTHLYTAADVHDFAWVAAAHLREFTRTFRYGDWSPVEIRLLLQPEHVRQAERHFRAAEAALIGYGEWLGEYPYPVLTLVDPPYHTDCGGMEYPTFILIGTDLLTLAGDLSLEELIVHEFGHQYWYGMVASDEFEEAWLDEGLTTYSTARLLSRQFGAGYHSFRLFGIPFYGVRLDWGNGGIPFRWWGRVPIDPIEDLKAEYLDRAGLDRVARRSWEFADTESYWDNVYDRAATALAMLDNFPQPRGAERVLAEFFRRYRFKHPDTDDFTVVAREVTGDDLGWLVDGVLHGTGDLDYAVTILESERVVPGRGLFPVDTLLVYRDGSEEDSSKVYRSRIRVERLGGISLPVTLEAGLEDGRVKRFQWEGDYRWHDFVFTDSASVAWARVDPEGKLLLDIDRANNSRTRRSKSAAVVRYAAQFLFRFQSCLALLLLGLG